MRGQSAKTGDTRVSQNGYHYTKTDEGWELTHRMVMEKHLGRSLQPHERVRFVNGDRTDVRIENLELTIKNVTSLTVQRARLIARRDELNGQIEAIDRELAAKHKSNVS